jgi:two-component system, CitB family, sensor kinase
VFRNRLHTIAGLIELGEYDEVRRYVSQVSANSDQWQAEVTGRIGYPAVAALLIAEASLAAKQGIALRMSKTSGQRGLGLALTSRRVFAEVVRSRPQRRGCGIHRNTADRSEMPQ